MHAKNDHQLCRITPSIQTIINLLNLIKQNKDIFRELISHSKNRKTIIITRLIRAKIAQFRFHNAFNFLSMGLGERERERVMDHSIFSTAGLRRRVNNHRFFHT